MGACLSPREPGTRLQAHRGPQGSRRAHLVHGAGQALGLQLVCVPVPSARQHHLEVLRRGSAAHTDVEGVMHRMPVEGYGAYQDQGLGPARS